MPKPKRPKPTRRDIVGTMVRVVGTIVTVVKSVTDLGPIFKKRAPCCSFHFTVTLSFL